MNRLEKLDNLDIKEILEDFEKELIEAIRKRTFGVVSCAVPMRDGVINKVYDLNTNRTRKRKLNKV